MIKLRSILISTLEYFSIPSREPTYPLLKGTFEDDNLFFQVGYISTQEAIWFDFFTSSQSHYESLLLCLIFFFTQFRPTEL